MEKPRTQIKPNFSAGESAVTGLLAGLQGGLAMAVVIALFSLVAGQGLNYLGYFANATAVTPMQGLVMHLAVSCIYGILYSLALRWSGVGRRNLPGWLTGLIYALVLWLAAITLLVPATHSMLVKMPWPAFLSGHLAYGVVLGERYVR